MNKKTVKTLIVSAAIVALLAFFLFVPLVSMETHPAPSQLAFLQIPTKESLSCKVFGMGAANWPIPSNPATWQGTYTYQFELGCPPVWTSQYPLTTATTS